MTLQHDVSMTGNDEPVEAATERLAGWTCGLMEDQEWAAIFYSKYNINK